MMLARSMLERQPAFRLFKAPYDAVVSSLKNTVGRSPAVERGDVR
jgi:hypothetical protein